MLPPRIRFALSKLVVSVVRHFEKTMPQPKVRGCPPESVAALWCPVEQFVLLGVLFSFVRSAGWPGLRRLVAGFSFASVVFSLPCRDTCCRELFTTGRGVDVAQVDWFFVLLLPLLERRP